MRKNNIIPIDISSSREYYGLNNSIDLYKGTSFKFAGQWTEKVHYFNDEYIIDFVAYDGSLWACQHCHLSSISNKPGSNAKYWTEVITGIEGKAYIPNVVDGQLIFSLEGDLPTDPIDIGSLKGQDGADGKDGVDGKNGLTYRPDEKLEGNYIVFRTENDDVVKVDFSQFKGEKGDEGEKGSDWVFSKAIITSVAPNEPADVQIVADQPNNPDTTYTLKFWIPRGEKGETGKQGQRGEKGETGNVGPSSEFKIIFDASSGTSILYSRPVTTPESSWVKVGPVGGNPGKSPKLIKVLGTTDNPDVQDETRRNDRILWGYDGVPVSEWTTLCYLDDLRGDENIWISTEVDPETGVGNKPVMADGVTEDKEKIWYDPYDESIDTFSTIDFIYQSYLDSGGTLTKDEFIEAFSSINKTTGFEIKFAKSFEDLGEPNIDKSNILWLVPSATSGQNNKYIEYIVLYNQTTDEYSWEQWGSQEITINLEDYYTKDEVDSLLQEVASTIWIPL